MAFLGLIKRKECWVPTGRGWIILFISVIAIIVLTITTIHPFLSVNHPVNAEILVVEGWLPDYALEKVISEFQANNYHLLVTTGAPLLKGSHLLEYNTSAEATAATLKELGFDEDLIVVVPAPTMTKDRTYASAMAIKNWLLNSNMTVKSINIYTLGPHARRSRLLFEKVLDDKMIIGVIAADNLGYDSRNWWNSSNGVRTLISEMVAYLYVRMFFYPDE